MGSLLVKPADERRVPVVDGFRSHFVRATGLSFPPDSHLRASALPPDLQLAARRAYLRGTNLAQWRHERINAIRRVAAKVRAVSVRINSLMPPSVAKCAAGINTAFIGLSIDAVGWLDTSLVEKIVHGFLTVGDCPDSGVYRPIAPLVSADEWSRRHAAFVSGADLWNHILLRRLAGRASAGAQARAADVAVAAKTATEVRKGAVVGPFLTVSALRRALRAAAPAMPRDLIPRLMERFGIPQKGSIRAIDNGKSNGANRATRLYETVTTPSFAFTAVTARAFTAVARADDAAVPPPVLTVALCDLTMAYRTIPTCQPWYGCFAFYNPDSAPPRPEIYYTPGHNFGLTAAVVNFNRYPEAVVIVTRALLDTPCDHYFDDFIIVDVDAGEDTALAAVKAIVTAFGSPRRPSELIRAPELDPGKEQPTATSNTVLGIITDFSAVPTDGEVLFRPDPERVRAVLAEYRAAFVRGIMLPAEAGKLRGKLYFTLSSTYANVGRAATLALVQRQYRDKDTSFLAGSDLHHSLLFFAALLSNDATTGEPILPPLTVPVVPDSTPPLLVYTDAAFSLRRTRRKLSGALCEDQRARHLGGGLGIVVYDPVDGTVRYAGAPPDWPTLLNFWPGDRKTYIAQLEVLAAISVYFTYPDLFAGRRVNHFIDNTVALSALVHGYSGKPDLATMVNAFYLQLTGLRSAVYFEYVPSKANIADLPSRDAWRELRLALAGYPRHPTDTGTLLVPDLDAWRGPLVRWATRHGQRSQRFPS